MRVLIVDDSRPIRSYVRLLLEARGFVCLEAGNGQEALSVMEQQGACDAALIDVNMPVMDGLACITAMRSDRAMDAMKIMMVTTEADHAMIAEALEAGADEYLMKPFDAAALMGKLQMMGVVQGN